MRSYSCRPGSRFGGAVLGLLLGAALAPAERPVEKKIKAEVVVYGATAGGVVAAVAAAREGKQVLLIEPGRHVGGMVSGGLGATDAGNRATIGGYAREFFDRVRAYYVHKYGPKSPQVRDCSDGFHFEPHVAEHIFKEMLAQAKVRVLFGRTLIKVTFRRVQQANLESKAIQSLSLVPTDLAVRSTKGKLPEADLTIFGSVWIDASYEGDLMARAGVRYTVGREGREKYQESLAGVQKHSPAHQWPVAVSVFGPGGKLLPFVQPGPAGEPGAGDKKVQAYNFRLCLTRRPELRLPFPRPPHYDPKRYELLARYLAKRPGLKVGQLMNPVPMPNGKTDTNNNGPFSTDYIGANWDYPEADYPTRARIWQDHVEYTQGFLYLLANDPCVPAALHQEMGQWGLAKGEFSDTGGWPHQLYVRESRRMLGVYVMTQADIMTARAKPDSVGLGSYNADSHHVQRVPDAEGAALNEGDFQVPVKPYAIPYRSLLPKAEECANLLVPVCLSASHVAYGSIRMEPVYMILGQAAGVAASLAVERSSVQEVPVGRLQERLRAQKAVLAPPRIRR
jgi:hypothetical protein